MNSSSFKSVRGKAIGLLLSAAVASPLALAQDQQYNPPPQDPQYQQQTIPPQGGFRRVGDPPPQSQNSVGYDQGPGPNEPASDPGYYQGGPQPPPDNRGYNNQGNYNQQPNQQYGRPVPAQLNLRAGTFVMVRVNEPLSSDHNQVGDMFTGTLVSPVVVDGVIVAERGETVAGRVTEAVKAGRVEGVSRLGVQLTDLTLVDGQQLHVLSQFVSQKGDTSQGRDVAAIGGTTALGAAVGAAADGGFGAGIGAAAGAVAGTIGVLLTRGHQSIIYPEQVLTFRVTSTVIISTVQTAQAFRYVEPGDYDRPQYLQQRTQIATAPAGPPAPYPYYGYGYGPGFYYGYGYGYPYAYGYGWGPGISFYYGGRGYYGHGYYGGYRTYGGGYAVRGGFSGGHRR